MGLANRLTEPGGALAGARSSSRTSSRALPQTCMRSDRRSSYEQWDLALDAALGDEFELGRVTLASGEARAASGPVRLPEPVVTGSVRRQLPDSPRTLAASRRIVGCRRHRRARTVADIMSTPVVTAAPGEQGRRSRRADATSSESAPSSSSTTTSRSASSPSATSSASPPPASRRGPRRCRDWMTAEPRLRRPRRRGRRRRSPASPSTGTATSRSSTATSSSASCRCATCMRIAADPAGRAHSPPRSPRASRASSSPRPRSATSVASRASTTTASTTRSSWPRSARSRTSGTCCSRASSRRSAERDAFIGELAPLREIPAEVHDVLPLVAALGGVDAPPLDMLRTTVSLARRRPRLPPVARHRAPRSCATQALRTCAVVPTLLTALYRLQHGLEPIAPHPDLPYAANYLYMMQRRDPEARVRACRRAVPDLDDRPRVQRVDLHRPGHHVDRRRPRGRGRRRDRRAVGAAARRCTQPCARHARRDRHRGQRRAVAARRGRARRPAHGLRPPRLQDRRPPLGHAARRRRAARRATRSSWPSRSSARPSRCWPS